MLGGSVPPGLAVVAQKSLSLLSSYIETGVRGGRDTDLYASDDTELGGTQMSPRRHSESAVGGGGGSITTMEGNMPLTKKGAKIKRSIEREYGRKKGEDVFYASVNKGTIKGAHKGKRK